MAGYDEDLPTRLLTCAWRESERVKARRLAARIAVLAQKLADILEADYMHSAQARQAARLKSAMGEAGDSVFDFEKMSRLLESKPVASPMPASRKKRLRSAISILHAQRFVELPRGKDPAAEDIHVRSALFPARCRGPGDGVWRQKERVTDEVRSSTYTGCAAHRRGNGRHRCCSIDLANVLA